MLRPSKTASLLATLGTAAALLAAALACIGGGGSSGGAVPALGGSAGTGAEYPFARYLPLNNGDSFTYTNSITGAVTQTSTEANLGGVSVYKLALTASSAKPGSYYTRSLGVTSQRGAFDAQTPGGYQDVYTAAVTAFPEKVRVGQTWQAVAAYTFYLPYGGTTAMGTGTITRTFQVKSHGPVATTLGTFPRALEVQMSFVYADSTSSNGSGTESYWYALDVGIVKFLSTSPGQSNLSGDLVSGTVGGAAVTIDPNAGKATSPSPADLATGVATTASLSWTAPTGTTGVLTYDVSYWTGATAPTTPNSAAQSSASYTPTTAFTAGQQYSWRVDVIEDGGTPTTGTVWQFTVASAGGGGKATTPIPADLATGIAVTTTLSWSAPTGVVGTLTYDVYHWTGATAPTIPNSAAQSPTTYNPTSSFPGNTPVSWRIDTIVNAGTPTTGDVWTFTTGAAERPVDTSTAVTQYPLLVWPAVTGATGYDVYFDAGTGTGGATAPTTPTRIAAAITATELDPSTAGVTLPLTATWKYHWRVDAITATGTTTGTTWTFTTGNETITTTYASTPLPPSATIGVGLTPVLEWTAAAGATQHDVYLWAPPAPTPTTPTATVTTNTSTVASALTAGASYTWSVYTHTANWISLGPQWTFTCGNPAVAAQHPATQGDIHALHSNFVAAPPNVIYFGAADNGEVPASTGGTTWTQGTPISPAATMRAAHYIYESNTAQSAYMVGGAGGKVYVQPAGVTGAWTAATNTDTNDLYDMHGTITAGLPPSQFLYAVGNNFTILQAQITIGATLSISFAPVATGLTNTNHLRGVWSSGASDVLIVGHGGTVLHYTGTWLSAPLTDAAFGTTDFKHVWCDDSALPNKEAFLVGVDKIVHGTFNGTTWTWTNQTGTIPGTGIYPIIGAGKSETLTSVWGVANNDVWATGYITQGANTTSTLLHWDGSLWTRYDGVLTNPTHPTLTKLEAITGTASNNFYAGGANGHVLRWNGANWTDVTATTAETLNDIDGVAANNVYAVGDKGAIINWNGAAWAAQTSGTTKNLNAVAALNATNIWAAGDEMTILKGNVGTWTVENATVTNGPNLNGIAAFDASNIWAVGDAPTGGNGTIYYSTGGGTWGPQTSPTASNLNGVVAFSAGTLFACGDSGAIIRSTDGGLNWAAMTSGTSANLLTLTGRSATDVYALGAGGVAVHYNGSGSTWTVVTTGATADLGAADAGTTILYAGGSASVAATPVLLENLATLNWGPAQIPTAGASVRGLWAESDAIVWTCGESGVVAKFTR